MTECSNREFSYDALRLLAVEDPKHARQIFCELLDGKSEDLHWILKAASAPGEGRVRQLIANAVRSREDKDKITSQLLRWQEIETDEFAKRAIDAAIDGVDVSTRRSTSRRRQTLVDPALVKVYRHVADRIRHQTNNALMEPAEVLGRLADQVALVSDSRISNNLMSTVSELVEALERIERIIGFNPENDFFSVRSVEILDWLNNMNRDYGNKFRPVKLSLVNQSPTKSMRITASDYLLQTVFWNLWINAQQAVSGACEIEVRARCVGSNLHLTVLDNGEGFPKHTRDMALPEGFSTKGIGRGRGLLEIQDAVEQLQGDVHLVNIEGRLRMRVSFQMEQI